MRIIGIDSGRKRIGVALSDGEGVIAQALTTLRGGREVEVLDRLAEALQGIEPTLFVVGLPLRLDGTEGGSAKLARRLAEAIRERFDTPVEFWDERLTSLQAERVLIEAGVSRKKRRGATDRMAATILLQAYLDANREKWLEENK